MAKNRVAYALSAMALLAGSGLFTPATYAESVTVSTFEELDAALCAGGEIELGADILADRWLASGCDYYVTKDTTIDFKGHTITSPENRSYNLDFYDATLTFKDTVGNGGYTQEGDQTSGINITNGRFVIDGGIINGSTWVVTLWHDAELEMNGGEIHASNGFAITGNGTTDSTSSNYGSNTKITINDGILTSANDYAIYNPSENSVVNINGGEITGGSGAIAANRGEINISGGILKSLGTAEVSGDVSQDGTRGYENAVIGIPKEYGPVTLNVTGGTFLTEGNAELIADVSNLDNENAAVVNITGGNYSIEPKEEDIADDSEAELEDGLYVIYPKEVDYGPEGNQGIGSDPEAEGQASVFVEFTDEFIADRKASLSATVLEDTDSLTLTGDGELIGAIDISVLDREQNVIEVDDNHLIVYIDIDEDTYNMLAEYDELYAVYFNDQGEEEERFEISLESYTDEEGAWYWLSFETTHLSTYGVVGVNTENNEEEAAAPNTGTVTAAGASAMSAALVTSIAVGLLTSIVSFAYLIRRR